MRTKLLGVFRSARPMASAGFYFLLGAVATEVVGRLLKHYVPKGKEGGYFIREERQRIFAAVQKAVQLAREKPRQSLRSWLGIEGAIHTRGPQRQGIGAYSPQVIIADRPLTPQDSARTREPASLTPEQIEFRKGLREVVTHLQAADAELLVMVQQVINMCDHPYNDLSPELAHYARIVVEAREPKVGLLERLVGVRLEDIDVPATQANIVKFLSANYSEKQADLRRISAAIKAKIPTLLAYDRWRAAHEQFERSLRVLKKSPEVTQLWHADGSVKLDG